MTRQIIRTDAAPAPVGPYNQAIVASGHTVFVAGQIAIDPRVGHLVYTIGFELRLIPQCFALPLYIVFHNRWE